jgi:hypothetical protein
MHNRYMLGLFEIDNRTALLRHQAAPHNLALNTYVNYVNRRFRFEAERYAGGKTGFRRIRDYGYPAVSASRARGDRQQNRQHNRQNYKRD